MQPCTAVWPTWLKTAWVFLSTPPIVPTLQHNNKSGQSLRAPHAARPWLTASKSLIITSGNKILFASTKVWKSLCTNCEWCSRTCCLLLAASDNCHTVRGVGTRCRAALTVHHAGCSATCNVGSLRTVFSPMHHAPSSSSTCQTHLNHQHTLHSVLGTSPTRFNFHSNGNICSKRFIFALAIGLHFTFWRTADAHFDV